MRLRSWQDLVRCLDGGGVVLLSTDTLPGLHCRFDRPSAIRRLLALKNRSAGKPLLLLAATAQQALHLMCPPDDRAADYARRCWPGPFTLIMAARPVVPAAVRGNLATVAVRVPADEQLQRLIQAVNCPLVSTSANRAGEEPALDMDAAIRQFAAHVDGVWPEGESAIGAGRVPCASALVDLTRWPPRIVREGPIALPHWPTGS